MCWCLRVYWTVLQNLFVRFMTNVANAYYTGLCCSKKKKKKIQSSDEAAEGLSEIQTKNASLEDFPANFNEYIIVNELETNYYQIPKKKIETEPYYRTVDRADAEEILTCRDDGSCLVRPYKERDISIKYIVSVYAQQEFFHLFIRQIYGTELYGIGQEKRYEKLFNTPSDIIDYYKINPLLCTNKNLSLELVLIPITS